MADVRLAIRGLGKSYGGVHALRDVGFDVAPGVIHGLVGENGAGKSTLIKILSGATIADAGSVELDGAPHDPDSPGAALAAGVATVYQEAQIVPQLTVAENVMLGRYPTGRGGFVERGRLVRDVRDVLSDLEIDLPVGAPAGRLSVAAQQLLQIARGATYGAARLLILDEPTSALTPGEAEQLFALMHRLRGRGTSVIFVSHRLEEILAHADAVTVLRDGAHIATSPIAEVTEDVLVNRMVGRELAAVEAGAGSQPGATMLEVEGLSGDRYADVSFQVAGGEIVGLFGLVGAGRSEVLRGVFGADPPSAGTIRVGGEQHRFSNPIEAIDHGLALVPEDRKREGLVNGLSIRDNVTMAVLGRMTSRGFVRRGRERALAERFRQELAIKAASVEAPVESLSGGNQQKVALAKWLALEPRVLMLDEPTAGIDVGAKRDVYGLVRSLAAGGTAVLLASSELPEILLLCHRVVVMHEGRVTGVVTRDEMNEERLMSLASAVTTPAAA